MIRKRVIYFAQFSCGHDHPLKPAGYTSPDSLWEKASYTKTNIAIPFEWRTLQPDQTVKVEENPMSF